MIWRFRATKIVQGQISARRLALQCANVMYTGDHTLLADCVQVLDLPNYLFSTANVCVHGFSRFQATCVLHGSRIKICAHSWFRAISISDIKDCSSLSHIDIAHHKDGVPFCIQL